MSTESTQQVGQITPDLKDCHVIRSHRKPRAYNPIGIAFIAAALLAAGVVSGTTAPESESPAMVEALPVEVVPSVFERLPEASEPANRSARQATSRTQKIEKVIKYALAQQGDRYKWGAAGPSRWDCSGLVSVAFKKGAGVKLPHQTGGIQKRGYKVSKRNLKRGDIVFPQRGHVGIYLGKGKMVHASSGKGRVVVAKVYGFYTARRVL